MINSGSLEHKSRINKLFSMFEQTGHDGCIISSPANVAYYTGLTKLDPNSREAFLLANRRSAILYHSPLLSLPPLAQKIQAITMTQQHPMNQVIKSIFDGSKSIFYEAQNLTAYELERFKSQLPQIKMEDHQNLLNGIRTIKSSDELQAIKQACVITQQTMNWIIQLFKGNVPKDHLSIEIHNLLTNENLSELILSQLIEVKLVLSGADSTAFPALVAFDENAATPHHSPSKKILKDDMVVLLDFGAKYQGYCADMSRTIYYSSSQNKKTTKYAQFTKIDQTVKQSFEHSLSLLEQKPMPNCHKLDHETRKIISQNSFPEYPHATGHGLGLEIHESPRISPTSKDELLPGMVITLEPGIYLEKQVGYRHEDTLLITDTGYQNLTNPLIGD